MCVFKLCIIFDALNESGQVIYFRSKNDAAKVCQNHPNLISQYITIFFTRFLLPFVSVSVSFNFDFSWRCEPFLGYFVSSLVLPFLTKKTCPKVNIRLVSPPATVWTHNQNNQKILLLQKGPVEAEVALENKAKNWYWTKCFSWRGWGRKARVSLLIGSPRMR